ncbi:DUF1826 domain-containing protein [Nitrosomonas sp. Is37]|uniref:DUF1826 domain-containing protein n=1 Tax=Nitrosomonas sp. Is37 TaxID=3080535 RepID=UPI00294B5978|nr:DUF1826 domain-containing protein [Nitrosomonas sp. Is37]MDV6345731.1 DUF1826 domain-containing protein [Nitrosomonas sp. Is37]
MRTSTLSADLPAHFSVRQSISVVGHEPEILSRIYDDPIKICILQRVLSTDVKQYVAYLRKEHVGFELAQPINVAHIRKRLNAWLPQHHALNAFIEDVNWLVEMFACLFDLESVGLRLNILTKTMCPRFHTDKVPCRLITTYAGKGTEWLDSNTIDRVMLAACNESKEKAEEFARQYPIQSLQEGDIALFKGERWGEQDDYGVIHRSPTLDRNETRLLLTLDFA